jgi:hypothetical protein
MSRLGRRGRAVRTAAPLVCRWDLDKTYLRSEFETIRQLLRTAFERGEDKVDVPGVVELIKVIREAADRRQQPCRILFVSASPPQIGKAIRAKLELDGVPYDGIVFKNQLQHLRPGKLRNLREHVGFKLVALLRGRLEDPPEARELLFGDDWESDSLSYSLYADAVAGRLQGERLEEILRRVPSTPSSCARWSASPRAPAAPMRSNASSSTSSGGRRPPRSGCSATRVVPTFNYFQTACVLAARATRARGRRARGAGAHEGGELHAAPARELARRPRPPRLPHASRGRTPPASAPSGGVLPGPHRAAAWRRVLEAVERLRARRQRLLPSSARVAPSTTMRSSIDCTRRRPPRRRRSA